MSKRHAFALLAAIYALVLHVWLYETINGNIANLTFTGQVVFVGLLYVTAVGGAVWYWGELHNDE